MTHTWFIKNSENPTRKNTSIKQNGKTPEETLSQKIYIRQIKMWKKLNTFWSLGKYKLKPEWGTTTFPLGYLKLKRLSMQSGNQNCYILLAGMQNGVTSLGKQFDSFLKAKYTPIIWSSQSTTKYLSNRNEIYVHIKTCGWMFTATLCRTGPNWEQLK